MIVVTTDGCVLSRGRRAGEFTKHGCGGGHNGKTLIQCHLSCREGVSDEFGIGFRNSAVLDISAPVLMVAKPPTQTSAYHSNYSLTWVQFMLLDAKQIVRIDEDLYTGVYTKPTTEGGWGQFLVGGERLKCEEIEGRTEAKRAEYLRKYGPVCFCFEPLAEVCQRDHVWEFRPNYLEIGRRPNMRL